MAKQKKGHDQTLLLAIIFLFAFIIMMSNDIYKGSLTVDDFVRSVMIGLFSIAAAIVLLTIKDKLTK